MTIFCICFIKNTKVKTKQKDEVILLNEEVINKNLEEKQGLHCQASSLITLEKVVMSCELFLLYIRLTMKNLIGREHSINSL